MFNIVLVLYLEFISKVPFAVFSFCYKNVSAATNHLVAYEKGVESFTQSAKSTHDYSNEYAIFEARTINQLVTEFIATMPKTGLSLTYIQYVLSTPLATLAVAYFLIILLVGVYAGVKSLLTFRFANILLLSAEQEFATPRAVLLLTSSIFCLLFASALPVLFGYDLNITRLLYATSLGLVLFLVLAIPLDLIYNWGAYFPIYIKGQSIKKSIIFEWLTDYIHVLSFFLRINIQLIRLVIITGVFYMYNNLYIEFIYPTLSTSPSLTGGLGYIYVGAAFFLKLAANLLYEIGHLWIIVGMQSGAFAMIVFIITQFLYSVYLIRRLLPFLKNVRSRKKN